MKKIRVTIICVVFALGLILTGCGNEIVPMPEGKYAVSNDSDYRDAYLTIKGDEIQFFNIDLNAIYREEALKTTSKYNEELSDEELEKYTDYNYYLVDNSYKFRKSDNSMWDEEKGCTCMYVFSNEFCAPVFRIACYEGKDIISIFTNYRSDDTTKEIQFKLVKGD